MVLQLPILDAIVANAAFLFFVVSLATKYMVLIQRNKYSLVCHNTTTNGGYQCSEQRDFKTKRCIVPILHKTPNVTTDNDKSISRLNERKKSTG